VGEHGVPIGHLFDHRLQTFQLAKFSKSLCIRNRKCVIVGIVFEILELVEQAGCCRKGHIVQDRMPPEIAA
jgi:hypothetical protein